MGGSRGFDLSHNECKRLILKHLDGFEFEKCETSDLYVKLGGNFILMLSICFNVMGSVTPNRVEISGVPRQPFAYAQMKARNHSVAPPLVLSAMFAGLATARQSMVGGSLT